jgi:hypothetical protein
MRAQGAETGPGALERALAEVGLRPESLDLRLGELLDTSFDAAEARSSSQAVRRMLAGERLSIANYASGPLLALLR